MKKKILSICLFFVLLFTMIPLQVIVSAQDGIQGRIHLNFNQGWKFIRKNVPEAIDPGYSIDELSRWENVNLPHTLREEPYLNSGKSYQGEAMYVKHFPLSASYAGKKLYIEFEGVMGVTDVWVNGVHLQAKQAAQTGENTNYGGYLPFVLDISRVVKYDGSANVITVLCDNRDNPLVPPGKPQGGLDFSYFGGIYRDVWLDVTENIHITSAVYEDKAGSGGVLAEFPSVSQESAEISVQTHLRNETAADTEVTLLSEVFDDDGNKVGEIQSAQMIPGGADQAFQQSIVVEHPKLWNLDTPNMHTLKSTVLVDGKELDTYETRIGIRTMEIDKERGLLINGEAAPILNGVNRHQEYAYIGNAMTDSLHWRDAVKFKSAGINTVRTAHYSNDPAFLEACDELGILVIEPTPGWQWYSSDPIFRTRVSQNIQQMMRRDRNHPSMLAYEIALNETDVPAGFDDESTKIGNAEYPHAIYSYGTNLVDQVTGASGGFYREYGDFMWAQSGNFSGSGRSMRSTAWYYPGGEARMVKQARERLWEGGGQGYYLPFLKDHQNNPTFLGGAQWTGIDHNRGYSSQMACCGMLDLYRIPKYAYYAYESQRPLQNNELLEQKGVKTGPMLFIASNWTEQVPPMDKPVGTDFTLGTDSDRLIDVYSNADSVKLSVVKDGKTLWEKTQTPSVFNNSSGISTSYLDHPPFIFEHVPFVSGSTLTAEGYDQNGSVVASQEVSTAGKPAKLELRADDEGIGLIADGSDLMGINAYVLDENGNVCSLANNEIEFKVEGSASIIGDGDRRVGANPIRAEAGIIGALIQAGSEAGTIKVTASSYGLQSAELEIVSQPMSQPAADYIELPKGPPIGEGSMYLCDKEPNVSGTVVKKETVTVNSNTYDNSITLGNASSSAEYYLDGKYERFTAKAGLPDDSGSSRAVVFKVYLDGVLKYKSDVVHAGEPIDIDLNVAGYSQIKLTQADDKSAGSSGRASYLEAYVYEGTEQDIDESEVRQNLALGKSVKASASEEGFDPAAAADGDLGTVWHSPVFDSDHPTWEIDLGAKYDVRSARVCFQYDSMATSYDLYTSSNGTDWDLQISNTKTGHQNVELDRFTAKDVQYVRLVFTDVTVIGIDWGRKAALSEFEIYKDMGVDSVTEYNLKGIEVEGSDIVFDPNVTQYHAEKLGLTSTVSVRALSWDRYASITMNGEPVENAVGATLMKDTVPMTFDLQKGDNVIEITVHAVNGVGAKTYRLIIKSDGGNTYNAEECLVPGQNGANGWWYQEQNKASGEFQNMTKQRDPSSWQGSQTWCISGSTFMHPDTEYNAVRTFRAPKAGEIEITGRAQLQQTGIGDVLIRVYQNGEQIWPDDGSNGGNLKSGGIVTIDGLKAFVNYGDDIRFVLDSNGSNGQDGTDFDTTVRYMDTIFDLSNFKIEGGDTIRAYNDMDATADFYASAETPNGKILKGVDASWTVEPAVMGVSVGKTGAVTVEKYVSDCDITLKAVSKDDETLIDTKRVSIRRALRPVNLEIVPDIATIFGSDPWNPDWGVDCSKAFDGNIGSFFDGTDSTTGGYVGIEIGKDIPVSAVGMYPRPSFVSRLNGSLIQGSDDKESWDTLATVSGAKEGQWCTIILPEHAQYRYYRLHHLPGDLLNVAEVKFYTPGEPESETFESIHPDIRVTDVKQNQNSLGTTDLRISLQSAQDKTVLTAAAGYDGTQLRYLDFHALELTADTARNVFLNISWDQAQFGTRYFAWDAETLQPCLGSSQITPKQMSEPSNAAVRGMYNKLTGEVTVVAEGLRPNTQTTLLALDGSDIRGDKIIGMDQIASGADGTAVFRFKLRTAFAGDTVTVRIGSEGLASALETQVSLSESEVTYQELTIVGADTLTGYTDSVNTARYTADAVLSDETVVHGISVSWSIEEDIEGVAIDAAGALTIQKGVPNGSITLKAVSQDQLSLSATFKIQLARSERPEYKIIPLDIGKAFGTDKWASWAGGYETAYDGDLGTAFDSLDASGAYTGMEIGTDTPVCGVGFYPRTDYVRRLNGAILQGSNTLDGEWIDLHTITGAVEDSWYVYDAPGDLHYRYYRLISYQDNLNVAEIEFYTPKAAGYHKGDVNRDGKVGLSDLLFVKAFILGKESFEEEQFGLADIDGNGKINVLDLLRIKLMILNGDV